MTIMQYLCVLCIVFVAFCPGFALASDSFSNRLADITQKCCNKGTSYAMGHTARDCTSSVPPEVPVAFGDLCKLAMDQCCAEFFNYRQECEEAIDFATTNTQCDSLQSSTGKSCCTECLKGTAIGENGGICVAPGRGSYSGSLESEAHEKCCEKASKQRPTSDEKVTQHTPLKKKTKHRDDLASMCEDFAPTELCAHHCVPVPGSYKCECNAGFQLMSDGRNCIEVVKNRCKPRNKCQHNCNDNGVTIKCSCRRGYKLKADGKSCEDIDECTTGPEACLPGTVCHNTQGSYKCLPGKKTVDRGQCPPGFSRNPVNFACDDINECSKPDPPCPFYLCENTIGGYKCGNVPGDPESLASQAVDRCPSGFKASGGTEECEDVDECDTNKHDCNLQSQICINTRGSFHCQDRGSKNCYPGFKMDLTTNQCEDIDECQESHEVCPSDQECVNTRGAYDCKPRRAVGATNRQSSSCPDGMRIKPGGVYCEDIDECVEGTHLCDRYQTCVNTNGSHDCHCKVGFDLDPLTGACIDVNECATGLHNCHQDSQRCDNTAGSFMCIRFISCGTGYILHHSTGVCEDVDECALGTDNCAEAGPAYMCVNKHGSYRCVRKTGSSTTTTAAPEYDYVYDYYDVNETDTNPAENNKSSSKPETTTNAEVAKPIEPSIAEPEIPTEPIKPIEDNLPAIESKFAEVEKPEVTEIPSEPITEVQPKETNPPQPKYEKPEEPKYEEPQEPKLENPQEPKQPEDNVQTYNEPKGQDKTTPHIVLLQVPKETATVKGEKTEDGSVVIHTKDLPKNEWTKISGAPETKYCRPGHEVNELGICVDIDECATHRHVCSGLTEICKNSIGGYICECAIGFRRDLITGACDLVVAMPSTDVPHVVFTTTSSTTTTSAPPTTTSSPKRPWDWPVYPGYRPTSRPFRPRSQCDYGYQLNKETGSCEDINECTNEAARCAAVEICVNTDGGFRCDCLPHWRYDDTRHRCVPVRVKGQIPKGYGNEGARRPDVSRVSTNKNEDKVIQPTFTKVEGRGGILKCKWGYRLGEDNLCQDLDECLLGTATCGPEQICTNLPGGYICSCPMGHSPVGDRQCVDIDECGLTPLAGDLPICSENSKCINTVGSYHCKCNAGFRSAPLNDQVCVDIDECQESRPGVLCQHSCINARGGYKCGCHRGYRLNVDNRTCSDVNECIEYKQRCQGRCLNEQGGYKCSCPSGYRLSQDNRSCIDIDECETGTATCPLGVTRTRADMCINMRGGYRCEQIVCKAGYKLEGRHRCTKVGRDCDVGDHTCMHQPSTYSYHYITFTSNLHIDGKLDLYTMAVPAWPKATSKFLLQVVKVDAPPTVKRKADKSTFQLSSENQNAVVSIVESLEGPQSIELELSMELYSDELFAGRAVAKLTVLVSEYEF